MDRNHLIIAAFDFDGTLTYQDTLLPFLVYTHGWISTFGKLTLQLPNLTTYLLGGISRQEAKESILKQFYAGIPLKQLQQKGEEFAKALDKHIKPDMQKRLQWHLQQGHRCVLISATLDVYLEPWAKRVGIHEVISSRMQATPDGKTTGYLLGSNCWGPEKVRRLYERLGPRENYCLYAYGDSRGDLELLAAADHAFYREIPVMKDNNESSD